MGYYLLDYPNLKAAAAGYPWSFWGYKTRSKPIQGFVEHVPVVLQDIDGADQTAENVARYFSTVDRPASTHVVIDADSIVDLLPVTYTAFGSKDANANGIHIEQGWDYLDWGKHPDRDFQVITLSAQWHRPHALAYDIPLRRVSAAEWLAGKKGFISHAELDPTRRKDPGPNYPWDLLFNLIAAPPTTGAPVTPIKGQYVASPAQALAFVERGLTLRGGKSPFTTAERVKIVAAYFLVGVTEGVRADVALAQACKETGFFSYRTPAGAPSVVQKSQNNFAGIGVTGQAGVVGSAWPTIEQGVRGHMRRLRLYADASAPNDLAVLQRAFPAQYLGKAPNVEDLGGKWAPSADYGISIVRDYLMPMIATGAPAPPAPAPYQDVVGNWAEPSIRKAIARGLMVGDGKNWFPDRALTRAELVLVLDKMGLL